MARYTRQIEVSLARALLLMTGDFNLRAIARTVSMETEGRMSIEDAMTELEERHSTLVSAG